MPGASLLHRFAALALVSGTIAAAPAALPAPASAATGDVAAPRVRETSVAVPDGTLADGTAHGFALAGGPELVALTWAGSVPAGFEARALDARGWSDWFELDGADAPAPDARDATPTSSTEPAFAGHDVARVELRLVRGRPTGVRIRAIDSDPAPADAPTPAPAAATDRVAVPAAAPAPSPLAGLPLVPPSLLQPLLPSSLEPQALASPPTIRTRADWGADESIRRHTGDCATAPDYVDNIRMAAVHHTAGRNDYQPSDVPAILRGIYQYHVQDPSREYCDIAYNFFVDKFGTIWEGRYGGIYRAIIGGHTSGFNSYAVGVAMIGTYDDATPVPQAAYNGLVDILAFKLGFAGVDPKGSSTVTVKSNSSARWKEGTTVTLPNIEGHRDSNNTDCPGNSLYARLPQLRNDVANAISSRGYTPGYRFSRLAGDDRYATASLVARTTFSSATEAYLARGDTFADALAANYAAGARSAPVLLSAPGAVPQTTLDALSALHVSKVHLLGGTDALAPAVQSALEAKGYTVDRIAGATRYATAALIARSGGPVGTDGDKPTAIVSSGTSFPDALAAGGVVYAQHFPQLLTDGTSLRPETLDALAALGITHVLVTGGTQAVGPQVLAQLADRQIAVERISGATRYETALALVDLAVARYGFDLGHVELATGESFPDALTAGPHVGTRRSAMLLTPRRELAPGVRSFLAAHHPGADSHVLGGTVAVDPLAKQQAEEAIDGI